MSAYKSLNLGQIRHLSYKKLRTWYAGLVKPKPVEAPFTHVVQIGDPTLRAPSDEVPANLIESPEIKYLIQRMKHVFKKYNCVGLSAPQIGVSLRVFMFEFNRKHADFYGAEERKVKEMELAPLTVVINPEIRITDYTKVTFTESCESVKGFYADVPRYKALELQGYGEDGKSLKLSAKGWLARIIQHEMDHLNGKVYTDIMDRKSLACTCWEVVNQRGGRVELPYGAN